MFINPPYFAALAIANPIIILVFVFHVDSKWS